MTSRHENPPSMEMLLTMIQADAAATALYGLEQSGYLAAEVVLPATPKGDAPQKRAVVLKLPVPSRKRI
jgi:hypothetical protein